MSQPCTRFHLFGTKPLKNSQDLTALIATVGKESLEWLTVIKLLLNQPMLPQKQNAFVEIAALLEGIFAKTTACQQLPAEHSNQIAPKL